MMTCCINSVSFLYLLQKTATFIKASYKRADVWKKQLEERIGTEKTSSSARQDGPASPTPCVVYLERLRILLCYVHCQMIHNYKINSHRCVQHIVHEHVVFLYKFLKSCFSRS